MDNYDFDTILDRRKTFSMKWDTKEGELPMWVADMDFMVAPEIRDCLKDMLSQKIYGYSDLPSSWYQAYQNYYAKKYGLSFDAQNLVFSLGVIPSVSSLVREFTKPLEKVAIFTPNYPVFYHSITNNNREIGAIPFLKKENSYEIDWKMVAETFRDPKVSFFLMSNPHNPSGKIFSKEELEHLAFLANKYDVFVLSDEIHGEIVEPGYRYVPYLSLTNARCNSVSCLSPTKAWNIAGLQTSAVLTYDRDVKKRVETCLNRDEVMEGNFFSYAAAISAYQKGGPWLLKMNEYIASNRQIVSSFLKEKLPLLKLFPSHSTYLLWIDASFLPQKGIAFADYLRKTTGLYLSDGTEFSPCSPSATASFLRMNIATSKAILLDGLSRLEEGVNSFLRSHR